MGEEQEGLLGEFHDQISSPRHHETISSAGKKSTSAFVLAGIATIISLAGLAITLVLLKITASRAHHTTGAYGLDHSSMPSCGSSPAEAKALGCHFDIMMLAWQPPLCYDDDLLAETFPTGRWQFYHDKNFTQPIDEEIVRAGTTVHPLFSSPDFHYEHCSYVWKKQMRAYAGKRLIDTKAFSYGHTVHCADLLAPRLPYAIPYTQVNTSYLSCVGLQRR